MRYGHVALISAVVAMAAVLAARPASAEKSYLDQFKAVYVKPKATDRTTLIFNEAVQKKGCAICHGANSTKTYNAYGEQLKKLLTRRDGRDVAKIKSALEKVAKMPSIASDSSSPTFGDRLKEGKLPVGEIIVKTPDAAK